MDVAYDHIQEEALSPDEAQPTPSSSQQPTLPTEFKEAFKAVSASPWGTTLGGWFTQARKQGETFYNDLQKEATEASSHATKGFESLRETVANRTRGVSFARTGEAGAMSDIPGEEGVPAAPTTRGANEGERPDSLPTDIVKEAGSLVASLRLTAAAKLKDLQRAEDAADEALLKFGTNVRNFLRDAVIISPPDDEVGRKEVLFETQEPGTGKKVFHSTRLDAQLHAIHMNAGSFTEDPGQGEEWKRWIEEFDVGRKTEDIAGDLERYEELRRAMERLVPEKVEYMAFWMRYYFLRKAVEEEEKRRKEVLKGAAANPEDEVAWDDEDEDEDESASTPQPHHKASESTTTLNAASSNLLKPNEPRRSEDENKSVAGSDASYDMVSGTTSRAMGSPKEKRKDDDDSDEDWE